MANAFQTREKVTLEEFEAWVEQPENSVRLFELIDGEIIEVMPRRTANSRIHELTSFAVQLYCKTHNLPCYTSSADGTYDVQGNAVAPDFAYKQTPMSD